MTEYFDQASDKEKIKTVMGHIPLEGTNIADVIFGKINPLGLSLADLKRNLERESMELREGDLMGDMTPETADKIAEKEKWIKKIDSYLEGKNEDFLNDGEQGALDVLPADDLMSDIHRN